MNEAKKTKRPLEFLRGMGLDDPGAAQHVLGICVSALRQNKLTDSHRSFLAALIEDLIAIPEIFAPKEGKKPKGLQPLHAWKEFEIERAANPKEPKADIYERLGNAKTRGDKSAIITGRSYETLVGKGRKAARQAIKKIDEERGDGSGRYALLNLLGLPSNTKI